MSTTLLEQMKSAVSQQSIGYAAKLLGESPANIEKAVSLAVPMILSAITAAVHTPSGPGGQSVVSRLVADPVNDGSLLHRLPALYQGTMTASPVYRLGAQLLHAVFGARLGKVTQTIAALSGIKPASAALLVNTLAPHVLSVLGKRHRLCGDATPHGLINLLDIERATILAAVPPALSEFIAAPAAAAPAPVTKLAPEATKAPSAVKDQASQPESIHQPYVKPPIVTKQSYQWSSWIPVIALYGAGAAGLAMVLASQSEPPAAPTGVTAPAQIKTATAPAVTAPPATTPTAVAPTAPVASNTVEIKAADLKTREVKSTEVKAAPVKPLDAKSAEAKPGAAPAGKSASAPAPATPVKMASAGKPEAAAPASTPVNAATEDISAQANPYKPPIATTRQAGTAPPKQPKTEPAATLAPVKSAEPAPIKTAEATPTPPIPPAPAPGTTSYYGTTPGPVIDTTAKPNPDYVPAPAPAATPAPEAAQAAPPQTAPAPAPAPVTIVVQPPPAKGTTTFFGVTPPMAEAPARPNPDYKPAPVAAEVPAPAVSAPTADPKPAPVPAAPAPVATAPAPAAPAPATGPSLATQAMSAVKSLIAPAPVRQPGVTSYFGTTPPVPEAAARPNPGYVPTQPPISPAPVAAASPAPPPSGSDTSAAGLCRASIAKAMKGGRIAFQSAKAGLRNTSIVLLDRVAETLKGCPGVRLTIEGHTDNTGKDELNQALSLARAKTVADYLTAKGVDASRISPVGVGSARPLAPNTSPANKARNRRIEFTLANS